MNDERPGDGVEGDRLAADGDRTGRADFARLEEGFGLGARRTLAAPSGRGGFWRAPSRWRGVGAAILGRRRGARRAPSVSVDFISPVLQWLFAPASGFAGQSAPLADEHRPFADAAVNEGESFRLIGFRDRFRLGVQQAREDDCGARRERLSEVGR